MPISSLSRFAAILHLLPSVPALSMHDPSDGESSTETYRNPSTGWQLDYDTARWRAEDETTDGISESFALASLHGAAPDVRVAFLTAPRGSDSLQAWLETSANGLLEVYPGASLHAAIDPLGDAILAPLGDHHWIGSYIVSSLPGDDVIVELDAIGIADADAVLIIRATFPPAEYDVGFFPVDTLRAGITYGRVEVAASTPNESGSRPRVQY